MYLIKGLLIFLPFLIYRVPIFDWTPKKERRIALVFGVIFLIIAFSPFSFSGWFIDYVVFFIAATLALKIFAIKLIRILTLFIQGLASFLLIGYVLINSLFGIQLVDKYEKGNVTFRMYMRPDMVAQSGYRLKVTQTWGPIEKFEVEKIVRGGCRYDFDLEIRVVTTDNCKDS